MPTQPPLPLGQGRALPSLGGCRPLCSRLGTAYSPAKLNVVHKTRSNPFTWRGQFTPELVEYFLELQADPDFLIGDPFSGSGTVLLESLKRNMDAITCEVNPAACVMSKFFELGAFTYSEKIDLCREVADSISWSKLQAHGPLRQEGKPSCRETYKNFIHFSERVMDTHRGRFQRVLILNILFKMEGYKRLYIGQAWQKAYREISSFLFSLPESSSCISALLSDARNLHKRIGRKIDLVITSPPYINVFNYHQNHRIIMELLDFDMLSVARSEFGANRKNRGNRFLTVTQYCLDMAQALSSIRRSMAEHGRVIMVIGRESNVRKTPFYNGKMMKDLCNQSGLFLLARETDRSFKNKFGTIIREDILILEPNRHCDETDGIARDIATSHLRGALGKAPAEAVPDLQKAIASVGEIAPSPTYHPEIEIDFHSAL